MIDKEWDRRNNLEVGRDMSGGMTLILACLAVPATLVWIFFGIPAFLVIFGFLASATITPYLFCKWRLSRMSPPID